MKATNSKQIKKLTLDTNTIRTLDHRDLARVGGGALASGQPGCLKAATGTSCAGTC